MARIIKKTIVYEGMPLRPLKMEKISILTARNLIKKTKNKKEKNDAKVIYKGLAKKDDPIYTGGFVINSFKKIKSNDKERKNGKIKSNFSKKDKSINKT